MSHLRKHAEMERLFGADFLPISKDKAPLVSFSAGPAPRDAGAQGSPKKKQVEPPTRPRSSEGSTYPREFEHFREEVLGCTKCGLCSTRKQVVFGVGPLEVPLMFVGEAPGQDEDQQGEPFVGRAGQLLTRTLQEIGVRRAQVYIGNILKCRPPGNRTPQPDEMAACMPWLVRQIGFVKPKIICGLGNIAVQTLLATKTGITRLRGTYGEAHGVRFFATFHPAYILRNMSEHAVFRKDLATVCRDAGLLPA